VEWFSTVEKRIMSYLQQAKQMNEMEKWCRLMPQFQQDLAVLGCKKVHMGPEKTVLGKKIWPIVYQTNDAVWNLFNIDTPLTLQVWNSYRSHVIPLNSERPEDWYLDVPDFLQDIIKQTAQSKYQYQYDY
jgi:hypothetical protein